MITSKMSVNVLGIHRHSQLILAKIGNSEKGNGKHPPLQLSIQLFILMMTAISALSTYPMQLGADTLKLIKNELRMPELG